MTSHAKAITGTTRSSGWLRATGCIAGSARRTGFTAKTAIKPGAWDPEPDPVDLGVEEAMWLVKWHDRQRRSG